MAENGVYGHSHASLAFINSDTSIRSTQVSHQTSYPSLINSMYGRKLHGHFHTRLGIYQSGVHCTILPNLTSDLTLCTPTSYSGGAQHNLKKNKLIFPKKSIFGLFFWLNLLIFVCFFRNRVHFVRVYVVIDHWRSNNLWTHHGAAASFQQCTHTWNCT